MLHAGAIASLVISASMLFESWAFVVPNQNPMDTLILVNKFNRAPAIPVALVKPNVPPCEEKVAENIYMRPDAASALEQMFAAAQEEGIHLYARSGFRSYTTQKAIYERKLGRVDDERSANASVAKPGYSEHQTGLAMDFEGESTLGQGLNAAIADSPEGIWVAENCHRFGFILRYPKDKTNITGYIFEPWHVRYVGVEAAEEITALGITFEEYIVMIQNERLQTISPVEVNYAEH